MSSDALDETDLSGNLTNEYVFFGGKRIARRDANNNVFYYFADHLGTSRVITNATGSICYDADFYPFGGERTAYTNTCPQNYKFTGKERDTESGLDDFEARSYSSAIGRFMSPDEFTGGPVDAVSPRDPEPPGPLPYADITNPQSLNKYAYSYNNPVRYIDRNGHCIEDACVVELGVLIYGAVVATEVYIHSPQGQRAINETGQALTHLANRATSAISSIFSAKDAQAGALDKAATEAGKEAQGAIEELGKAVAAGASKEQQQKANQRASEQQAGLKNLQKAQNDLAKASGKAKEQAKQELQTQIKNAKDHTKAIQQLIKNIVKPQ